MRQAEILKSDDSRISNPEIRNLESDWSPQRRRPISDFKIS